MIDTNKTHTPILLKHLFTLAAAGLFFGLPVAAFAEFFPTGIANNEILSYVSLIVGYVVMRPIVNRFLHPKRELPS